MSKPALFHLMELSAFRSLDHAVDTQLSLIVEEQSKCNYGGTFPLRLRQYDFVG